MNKNNSLPLEWWRQVFISVCQQVESAEVNSSEDLLNIVVKGRAEALQATHHELDDAFHKFGNNVQEVVTSFMKKHGVLVIYENTLVGYFDIQGYSSFIAGASFKDAIWKMNNLISEIKSAANTDIFDVRLDCWILSDSIILVVDTERSPLFAGSVAFFLGTCAVIMADAMRHGFPLRGAIGGGNFFKDGELMVSSALVDAARYEKEQNWLGAVLTPTAYDLVNQAKESELKLKGKTDIGFSSDGFKPFIKAGKIPWKIGNNIPKPNISHYIKPFHMADKNWVSNLPAFFKDNQEKIENSHCLYGQE
jgi:hypothetical protein